MTKMIKWISEKEDIPELCCVGRSVKVLVCGIDDGGDKNWGTSFYDHACHGWDYLGWQKITHWAYMPDLPEIF